MKDNTTPNDPTAWAWLERMTFIPIIKRLMVTPHIVQEYFDEIARLKVDIAAQTALLVGAGYERVGIVDIYPIIKTEPGYTYMLVSIVNDQDLYELEKVTLWRKAVSNG